MKLKKSLITLLAGTMLFSNPQQVGSNFESGYKQFIDINLYSNPARFDLMGCTKREKRIYMAQGCSPITAEKYLEKTGNTRDGVYYHALKISPEKIDSFEDTDKPNAVVVYSAYDDTDCFIHPNYQNILKNIEKNYDVYFKVCSSENDFIEAIDKVENPELIYTLAHGNYARIKFNKKLKPINQTNWEKNDSNLVYAFDYKDKHIMKKLSEKGNATFVLNSCSTGRHFAKEIKKYAPNLKVVSSPIHVWNNQVVVDNYYPMDIKFYYKGEDRTQIE